jgi:hypothetical protein
LTTGRISELRSEQDIAIAAKLEEEKSLKAAIGELDVEIEERE